jgi:uncharacterized protein YdhG (YjbR/CyaY superfamily)
MRKKFNDINEYIACFPKETQKILEDIRIVVKDAAPGAIETIKYSMPTLMLKGNLIHFAAFKNHIGLYPSPSGDEAFKNEIAPYKAAKSSIRFPIDKPIPFELIRKIIKFRISESMNKGAGKNEKRT